jgi:hypothetical protein
MLIIIRRSEVQKSSAGPRPAAFRLSYLPSRQALPRVGAPAAGSRPCRSPPPPARWGWFPWGGPVARGPLWPLWAVVGVPVRPRVVVGVGGGIGVVVGFPWWGLATVGRRYLDAHHLSCEMNFGWPRDSLRHRCPFPIRSGRSGRRSAGACPKVVSQRPGTDASSQAGL